MSAAASAVFVLAQLGAVLGTNVTDAPMHRRPHLSFNTESVQLLTGIVLAIAGNLVISISLNVQKHVHNLNDAKPESERKPFTSNPMWWLGLSGTVAGEVGNFLAFGFAGADIVTPLGAVGVVSNAVIACVFLGELFRIRDALGVLLTCLGTVLIVIKAPASERDMSVELFAMYVSNPIFACYIFAVVVVAVALWLLLPRLQSRHPAYGLLLCSLLGTATVLCSTALANFIRVSVNGDQQFTTWQPYVLVLIAIPTAIGQVRYLNSTMELFDNTKVRALYRPPTHAGRARARTPPPTRACLCFAVRSTHTLWRVAGGADVLHPLHTLDDHRQRDALPRLLRQVGGRRLLLHPRLPPLLCRCGAAHERARRARRRIRRHAAADRRRAG
jgi:hypothetical protein